MDFMFLNKHDQTVIDFDIGSEIVSKDKFFERAKKYISTDKELLLQRQALFFDILKIDGISEFLTAFNKKLTEYSPLTAYTSSLSIEEKFQTLLYPTAYTELVKFVYEALVPLKDKISSDALKCLYRLAEKDIESEEYKRIERYYHKNTDRLRSVKSVTVGVNLDSLYQPKEAGIISLNSEEFKSGDLLDRIIRLDFEKDDNRCIAPITVIDKKLGFAENQQVNYAFLKAVGKVLNGSLHHCSNRSLKYVKEKLADYFDYLESLHFTVEAINRIKIFKEKNIPLCFPKISSDRTFAVTELYDNTLCLEKDKNN